MNATLLHTPYSQNLTPTVLRQKKIAPVQSRGNVSLQGRTVKFKAIFLIKNAPSPPTPSITGLGAKEIASLTSRWVSLDSEKYPGAGPGTLTPDGHLDPLLAFAYDAVFALVGAIEEVHMTANEWGGSFPGLVTKRCVFFSEADTGGAGNTNDRY